MYFKNMLVLAGLLTMSSVSYAGSCNSIQSYKDILKCAGENAPSGKIAEAELKEAQASLTARGQWKNPEFSGQTIAGKAGGANNRETDLALNFPISLTRGSQQGIAEAQVSVKTAEMRDTQALIRAETFLKLHRLRQLLLEKSLLDESLMTFTKLTSSYERRPLLSPEQQVSLALFRMAKSDYQLKLSENADEIAAMEASLVLLTGVNVEQIRKNLPAAIQEWPKGFASSERKSSALLKAESEVLMAQSELRLAGQESFSELSIGPAIKLLDEGGDKSQMLGVAVSFPLPVFNLNGAGKESAKAKTLAAELSREKVQREQESERAVLISSYDNSVAALKSILSSAEMEKKHASVEQLFIKGVVPSSLVIEAHRGLVDLEKSRSEREIATLEKLLRIHNIDGRLSEVEL